MSTLATAAELTKRRVPLDKNVIPAIIDPMGSYWQQPKRDNILIDDQHAVMGKKDFEALLEYSSSTPSGVYEGKMWRRQVAGGDWYLCWFGYSEKGPNVCSNNYRKILLA